MSAAVDGQQHVTAELLHHFESCLQDQANIPQRPVQQRDVDFFLRKAALIYIYGPWQLHGKLSQCFSKKEREKKSIFPPFFSMELKQQTFLFSEITAFFKCF